MALVLGASAAIRCGPAPSSAGELAAYTRSLAIVTGAGPEAGVVDGRVASLPRRRARALEVPTRTTSLGGFLELQRCSLGELIGARNSGMGRVMPEANRLAYELEFLRRADACLDEPSLGREQRDALAELATRKRDALPAVYWNALWLSPELEALLAVGGATDGVARPNDAELHAALTTIASWGEGPLGIESSVAAGLDEDAVARAFAALHHSAAIGPRLAALERLRGHLDRAATLLDALDEDALARRCDGPARGLEGVFRRYYVGRVQPQQAALDRAVGPLIAALDRVYRATARGLAAPPEAARQYHAALLSPDAPGGLWRRYRDANARHARAWQRVADVCGFAPGG
ncbi:MAG: DUF3080 family protein [Myxococcales bacterium]|nr:DUF3080 family protein [Myxococcales bacterium]